MPTYIFFFYFTLVLQFSSFSLPSKNLRNTVSKSNLFDRISENRDIQGVSEIRVLILTTGRTCNFMKLFSVTFCKFAKVFQDFLPPIFFKQVVLRD
jgi:hypothetical protein